jgi:FixJ family two-component response regulator
MELSSATVEARVPKTPEISIIDDDESAREGKMDLLKAMGFIAGSFSRAEDFLKSERFNSTSSSIADAQMPGMTGLELHQRLTGSGKAIPTILIAAYPNDRNRARALQAGVICYLTRPFNENDRLACIRSALKHPEGRGRES